MRLAIVGTGVSGLVCAHLLHQDHDLTVYEAGERPGGHVNTVDVSADGESLAIDTGFIVYNERTYPLFSRLLERLGVATQPSDMSFGVTCERSGMEWASHGLSGVFAQRLNLLRPSFRRMLRDILRFNREAPRLLALGDDKVTLGDYLMGAGYSQEFVTRYVVPMGAAIWSSKPDQFLSFPAQSFVRFFANHNLLKARPDLPWRVITGGSRCYVDALIAPFADRVRTRQPVRALRRSRGGVDLLDAQGAWQRYDRVILAVHSDQALGLLEDPNQAERRVLSAIRYQPNRVTLHTDRSVMPRRERAWASWNSRVRAEADAPAFVTYHMNRLQGLSSKRDFFVTLNGADRVDPGRVLAEFSCDHPVFDGPALQAQQLHPVIDGVRGTHFCGAYWGYGFHEDGVRSAVEVCRKFGREL